MTEHHNTDEVLMGEVIDLPTRRTTTPHHASTDPGQVGAGGGGHNPPPTGHVTATGPDNEADTDADTRPDNDPEEGRTLVDAVSGPETGKLATALTTRRVQRRPVIPAWVRSRVEFGDRARWLAAHIGHSLAYHAVRVPLYAARLALRSPRGLARVVTGLAAWMADAEAMPLRMEAVARKDADAYMRLLRMRDDRVRWRRVVVAGAAVGTVGGGFLLLAASGIVQVAAVGAAVALLGWYGSPADKPLLDVAVVVPKAQKLTSEIVIRALSALGISEINKAVAKGGTGITFPAPITRDGPGWRADVDLPYGVTVSDIMERRDRLASGLRRPLGCVWPEPAHDQHAGRLVLWVGDQDMNQVKPPIWPLSKTGAADVFKAIPFGTDQRGRPVTLTLMFANVLIGAMPRIGKTFSIKPLLLASGLDPTVETLVFELKGTGDLDFAEKYAHRYGSGPDDDTIAACLDALRYVHRDIERRAKVIRGLPKDVCPENKVTPQLAAKKSLRVHPLALFIDECQELFSHPSMGKEAGELATAIIKRGPAMGVYLVLATQRPDKDSMPTGISANVGIRFCLRVMGQVENDMVLGTSAYRNGIRATTFTRNDRGIGYLVGEADDPQIVRTYYIDRNTADRVAERARAARMAAGTLAGYAAGEDTTPEQVTISLLDDIGVVMGTEAKVWSHVIVDRLAELRPGVYGEWAEQSTTGKAKQLAAALRPYGITTRQISRTENGREVNNKGIWRDDVITAIENSQRTGTR
jgi:S-DNA-T family DNA segregation ATPase FtsK/SpoIIIE